LRDWDAAFGELLLQYDISRNFDTLSGVRRKGGGIDKALILASMATFSWTPLRDDGGTDDPRNVFLAFPARRGGWR
jgi:hypothetical protein